MAHRKVTMLLNLGLDDQKAHGIPNGEKGGPPREGEVISVDDKAADILVHVLKCAKEHDAKAEAEHAEVVRGQDEARREAFVAQNPPPQVEVVKEKDKGK